ncbi:MAG: fatty acid desaturase [Solirubrobacteraceae bacterium]|nr:fatty acid desaturase [Solirubrobacteraceae bacterium]
MSTVAPSRSHPVTISRIPDPAEPVPAVAWPTVALLIGGIALAVGSTALGVTGTWPGVLTVVVNAVAAYLLFTVSHDAAHHAASSNDALNRWLGRISTPFFAPQASFAVWRFIHMQHHRFTNHDDGSDPDAYTMGGPAWQRPLRWLTIDVHYVRFFLRHASSRPRAEKVELFVQWAVVGTLAAAALIAGYGPELLLFWIVPQRLAIVWLAFAFDYLPHHGLHHRPSEDKLKTTRNRVGGERWVSPLLLYQNYHLVHHLHPVVPFYRYLAVWRRNEDAYLEGDPALSTVRGRPLTADEYRRLRELADH